MVRNETWQKALLSPENYACIACLEQRLGRRLTLADFPRLEINNPTYGTKSPELLKRLKDWRVFPKNAIPQDGPNITESQYKAFIKKHPEYDL